MCYEFVDYRLVEDIGNEMLVLLIVRRNGEWKDVLCWL